MKLLKITILTIFLIFIFQNRTYGTEEIINSQMETLKIQDFIKESSKYTQETFPDINIENSLTEALSGRVNNKTIFSGIVALLGKEVISTITLLGSIIAIIVIHSILKSISENLGGENVGTITYYVEYILIITLIMANFTTIITLVKDTIGNLVSLMYMLVPIILALMVSTGNVASATVIEPVILSSIIFIGNIITYIILPVVSGVAVLSIISNISDKVQIGKLAKFFRSSIVWVLGTVITIFIGILSIEGTLSSNVDGLAAKGVKTAASTFIPVVGKALGDSVETVLGCATLLKNAIGVVGLVVIISIVAIPIIKLSVLTIMYSFTTAICEPIADKKIINVMEQIKDTFKILLAIMFFVAVLLIIGITLTLKITKTKMLY